MRLLLTGGTVFRSPCSEWGCQGTNQAHSFPFKSRFHYIRHPKESACASQASRQNVCCDHFHLNKALQPTTLGGRTELSLLHESQPTGRDHLCFCGSFVEAGKDCNFGDTVERILQDKIVFSINNEVIQKKLLDEPTNRH